MVLATLNNGGIYPVLGKERLNNENNIRESEQGGAVEKIKRLKRSERKVNKNNHPNLEKQGNETKKTKQTNGTALTTSRKYSKKWNQPNTFSNDTVDKDTVNRALKSEDETAIDSLNLPLRKEKTNTGIVDTEEPTTHREGRKMKQTDNEARRESIRKKDRGQESKGRDKADQTTINNNTNKDDKNENSLKRENTRKQTEGNTKRLKVSKKKINYMIKNRKEEESSKEKDGSLSNSKVGNIRNKHKKNGRETNVEKTNSKNSTEVQVKNKSKKILNKKKSSASKQKDKEAKRKVTRTHDVNVRKEEKRKHDKVKSNKPNYDKNNKEKKHPKFGDDKKDEDENNTSGDNTTDRTESNNPGKNNTDKNNTTGNKKNSLIITVATEKHNKPPIKDTPNIKNGTKSSKYWASVSFEDDDDEDLGETGDEDKEEPRARCADTQQCREAGGRCRSKTRCQKPTIDGICAEDRCTCCLRGIR